MSTLTGNVKQIAGVTSARPVKVRAVSFPIVVGNVLLEPGELTVRPDATGFWSAVLAKGTYELTLQADNGQVAKCTVDIPDDANTYSFDERIVSSLPSAVAPVGGAQPTASASVLGIVKTDESVIDPVCATGWFSKATHAEIRAIPNKQNNKLCVVLILGEIWRWVGSSLSADNDSSVLKPDDTAGGSPGRWIRGTLGGTTGAVAIVATRDAMKDVDPALAVAVMITDPEEGGVGVWYYFAAGSVETANNTSIVNPNAPFDTLGQWIQRI